MSWAVPTDIPRHTPLRPNLTTQHSSSLPSTPYQHPRDLSFTSRSPSPPRGSSSPRSTHSENNHILPSLRKQYGGCKYETGMAHFRRRMPYSLGSELLPEEPGPLKERLEPKAEEALTVEMKDLFQTLLPSAESEQRKSKFVQKLENMLNKKWPGNDIKVNVFGSSGNKLCSSNSDVDICITTPFKELERVCILADFLAKNGMERVVCVSHAKVPIVKIWDPELELACDMNVNNTLALENTRMIKTYVDIDERVRPLAMIIKYWTKRRILNDAALGGTLSSYTWICLIINFLQTRSPPILPSLQRNHKQQKAPDGTPTTFFDDDLDKLKGFGRENKSTLGELLFQFFRCYGHEIDYETKVMSVREGKLISKEGKGWHLLQNNRLCVEEPFNNSRNLGNTADDTSFRGLHMELRRAFAAVSEGNFEECCAQYEYPPEEERSFERPPQQPRPIIAQTPPSSSRGGRGGGRGGRHGNQYNRGPNSGRRASSAANRPNNTRPANPSFAAEIALQAQQAQYMLHDHLYQQIQLLQAQEQELRMQLQNQSLISGRPPPTLVRQPYLHFPYAQPESSSTDENSRARAGTVNHPPLTTPVRQHVFYNPNFLPVAVPSYQGTNTNPPSPSMTSAVPELRRNHRRSSASNTSPRGSLRAQSQPARPIPSTVLPNFNTVYPPPVTADGPSTFQSGSPKRTAGEGDVFLPNGVPIVPKSPYVTENRPSEYVGYYVGEPTQPLTAHGSSIVSPLSVPGGLAIQNGGFPAFARGSPEHRSSMKGFSERLSNSLEQQYVPSSNVSSSLPQPLTRSKTQDDRGPLIIDGSVPPSDQRYSSRGDLNDQFVPMSPCMSASEDRMYNTPGSVSDTMSQDMQEQFAYDDEYDLAYDRKAQEFRNAHVNGWKQARINGPMVNGHLGRLETLSEKLQRFQMSGVHSPSEFHGKSGLNSFKEASSYFFPMEEHTREPERHERNGNAAHTPHPASGPSPAKDNKGNSSAKGQPNGVNVEKGNSTNHRGKQKGRQETQKTASSTTQETDKKEKKADAQRKPNGVSTPNGISGHSNTHTPVSSSGWQTTTKKRHKKGAKDTAEHNRSNNTATTANGAEPLPTDESLRKGG